MDELRPALSRDRFDLVLLNLSDALKLKQPVQSAPSDPLAVPVVNASARDQVQTAEREYAVALKSDSKSKAYLFGISKAVELRDRRAPTRAQARKSGKVSRWTPMRRLTSFFFFFRLVVLSVEPSATQSPART